MKTRLTVAALVGLVSSVTTASVHAQALAGSDTLEVLTKQLLANATCNPGSALTYQGGGSGTGESAMIAGTQRIAPMSRALRNNATVCGAAEGAVGDNSAEGIAFALDGVLAYVNPANDCNSNTTITALRTLYFGVGTTGNGDCNHADRLALARNYSSLFSGDPSCPDCRTASTTDVEIKHAFRRGDRSGTTDVFRAIVAPPLTVTNTTPPYCNGATDFQDNDPIRVPCSSNEQVCQPDGTLGLVLPIVVPEKTGTAYTKAQLYDAADCSFGRFMRVDPPLEEVNCCTRNRSNGTGGAGGVCSQRPILGKCLTPKASAVATNLAPCLNGTDDLGDKNNPIGYTGDARAFNLTPRLANGAIVSDATRGGTEIASAFYRILTNNQGIGAPSVPGAGTELCQDLDATHQIGCLVSRNQCYVGFAGGEAEQEGAKSLSVNAIAPTDQNIQNLVLTPANTADDYPLARKLYLNSVVGFQAASLTAAERALSVCFAQSGTGTPIDNAIIANGFIRLPGSTPNPFCEEACPCPSGTSCAPLPNDTPADGPHCANNPANIQ
jgi:hypothetical protein